MYMRIMIEAGSDQCRGLSSVFKAVGHEVYEWNRGAKPAFDAFDEFGPEMFLSYRGEWTSDRAIGKCLNEMVCRNSGIGVRSLQNIQGLDTFRFKQGVERPELKCHAACLITEDSDMEYFNKLVIPMIDKGYNVKVVGLPIGISQYLGQIKDETLCDLYASAGVSINLSPQKSYLDIYGAGGMAVMKWEHQVVPLDLVIPPMEINFSDDRDMFAYYELVFKESNQKHRRKWIGDVRNFIYSKLTYWHRAAEVFASFGLNHEHDRIMEIYNATKQL